MTLERRDTYERPPRPKNLDTLVEFCAQAMHMRYGDDCFTMSRENVHWVFREEFDSKAKQRPKTFIGNVLSSIGATDPNEEILGTGAYLRDYSSFPPNIYIASDNLKGIEGRDLEEKTWGELEIASMILRYTTLFSRIPRVYQHELLNEELKKRLDRDRRRLPIKYPQIDKDLLSVAIENVKMFIDEDETRRTIIEGAEISCRCQVKYESEVRDEPMAITGTDFEGELSDYLAAKPLEDFSKPWIETYPDELRGWVTSRYKKILQPDIPQKMADARIASFLHDLGLSGFKDTYRAHLNSEIPIRFIEARKKKKKLVYPD